MKKALAYARVSTKEQAQKGLSIPAQLKAIREYANSHGFKILKEYVDMGESAKTADRPAFKEMIKRCQRDKSIDAIIVHKIDRFSRNNIDFYAYKAILKKEGVRIVSVTENIEETPSGEFIENVLVAMAQFYSRNLAEEVLKGMKEKFKRGEWPLKAPIGYKNKRDERGHAVVIVDKEKAELVKQMFELYATGEYSLGALSEEMAKRGLRTRSGKLLSPERIKKILKNKFYIGKMTLWGETVKGKHKAIVPESLFNRVQQILKERGITQEKKQKRDFLLRGLLYCLRCKRKLTAEVHPRGNYYRCQSSLNVKCSEPYIPVKLLDEKIGKLVSLFEPSKKLLKLLRAEIEEVFSNFVSKSKSEIKRLKRKIAQNEAKLDALVDNLASRVITPEIYKRYSQRYLKEIEKAKERLAVLEKDYSSSFDFIDKCMILASTLSKLYQKLKFRQRKKLLKAIFKRIWVKNRDIKKVELNPPFDFLLKGQTKKIHKVFPKLLFEHYPLKSTTEEKFEHLVESTYSVQASFIHSVLKECL